MRHLKGAHTPNGRTEAESGLLCTGSLDCGETWHTETLRVFLPSEKNWPNKMVQKWFSGKKTILTQ